jgi:acyl-CoA thioester hydrolase
MEVGRVEYCRTAGVAYKDMEADGILLAVAEVSCRYLSPARYDDEVVIRTSIAEANPRIVRFEYAIVHAESERVLATGWTRHVFLTKELRPTKLPQKYRPLFGL